MNTLGWSFNEFCTYTLLCIACADKHLDKEELDLLNQFLVSRNIKCPEELVHELSIVLKYQTESERITEITNHFVHFIKTPQDADMLVDLVEEMIMSDLQIDVNEMEVYRIVKKLSRESF